MKTYSIALSAAAIQKLKARYQSFPIRTDLPHTLYQIKTEDSTITAYTSGKVVFQGDGAFFHAQPYLDETAAPAPTKDSAKISHPMRLEVMSGSDEVGTGSYFGPITVCACYIDEQALKKLPLGILTDSKKINDLRIWELGPLLRNELKHSLLILDNATYNRIRKTSNMNIIKAKLHNKAFLNLQQKADLGSLNVIDQFVGEASYFNYLKEEPEVFRNLRFEVRAEHQYIAVACASIIARYAFLESLKQMSEHYGFDFPSGAGSSVDEKGRRFVAQHSPEELVKVAKLHFSNTTRILGESD